jgi:hypothetical protein
MMGFTMTPLYQRLKFPNLLVDIVYNTLFLSILLISETDLKLRVYQLNVKIVSLSQRLT